MEMWKSIFLRGVGTRKIVICRLLRVVNVWVPGYFWFLSTNNYGILKELYGNNVQSSSFWIKLKLYFFSFFFFFFFVKLVLINLDWAEDSFAFWQDINSNFVSQFSWLHADIKCNRTWLLIALLDWLLSNWYLNQHKKGILFHQFGWCFCQVREMICVEK